MTLAAERNNGSERVPRDERFARALARTAGWPVTDVLPTEIGP